MARIPPSERLAERVEQLRRETDVEDLANELVRLRAKKPIQELLEAEVTEALGRVPYERRAGGAQGYRNGYKRRRLDTAEGRLTVDVPQVREMAQAFRSELWQGLKRLTAWLERLVVELYVRGLSTRDIEDALAELTEGQGSLLSRSSVSRLTEMLWRSTKRLPSGTWRASRWSTSSRMPSTSPCASRPG